MYYHVYASSATHLLSAGELVSLLDKSRANNAALGVTGMLLYKDGNFIQALEGERSVVQGLMNRIERDTRHRGILHLLSEDSIDRQFSDWSMGFRNLTDPSVRALAGFSEFMNASLSAGELGADPNRAQRLLLSFRRAM